MEHRSGALKCRHTASIRSPCTRNWPELQVRRRITRISLSLARFIAQIPALDYITSYRMDLKQRTALAVSIVWEFLVRARFLSLPYASLSGQVMSCGGVGTCVYLETFCSHAPSEGFEQELGLGDLDCLVGEKSLGQRCSAAAGVCLSGRPHTWNERKVDRCRDPRQIFHC